MQTMKKFSMIAMAAKMPKEPMGMTGEMAVARNATAVVMDVFRMAPAACLYAKAMRCAIDEEISGGRRAERLYASVKTNRSSDVREGFTHVSARGKYQSKFQSKFQSK